MLRSKELSLTHFKNKSISKHLKTPLSLKYGSMDKNFDTPTHMIKGLNQSDEYRIANNKSHLNNRKMDPLKYLILNKELIVRLLLEKSGSKYVI